jgi:UDP:flavonoid glycosyltransferase YjiC (YdhE family)
MEMFAGAPAARMASDVIAHAESWRPDLIVRDACEFGGYLAGDALRLPYTSVGVSAGIADLMAAPVVAALNRQRALLGLPSDPVGARIHRYLHAHLMPAAYDGQDAALPHSRSYRVDSDRPGERLPGWMADVDQGKPVIFASFGTLASMFPVYEEPLRAVVAGLADLDCTGIVGIGTGKDPDSYGPLPENVRLVDWISQPLMLQCSDLFVTHAGYNSVRQALGCGVPMVTIPLIIDNFAAAARCADLGLGVRLEWDLLGPSQLASACRATIGDPGFQHRARKMQRRILASPSVNGGLTGDLEELIR